MLYWSDSIPSQQVMRQGLEQEAERINQQASATGLRGIRLLARVAGDGPKGIERQMWQMRMMVDNSRPDAIIIQPTDNAALAEPVQRANLAGIPVIAYDQFVSDGVLASYITSDNYQAGYLGGEYIASLFARERPLRLVLVEYPVVSSTVERVNGFFDALDAAGVEYQIMRSYQAVQPDEGRQAVHALLRDFPDKGSVDVLFTVNNGVVTERDAHGRPLRMIGARQDITARKRVESTALKESERFKALIKASDTGAWEWDARKQALWCGAEYFSMLGYDKRDFADTTELQKVWTNLLHPDDRAEASRKFADYLAGDNKQLYENEFRMRHASGSWVWISSRGRTLPDAEGRPTALTVGAHINITSLKEAQASLLESQQRLQLISDSIPDSMVYRVECGLSGEYRRFSYISRGVEQLHGITAEQAMADAQLVYEQFIIDQDSMRIYEAECIAEMKTFRMEAEIIRPDGEHRWMLLISSPRRLPDGLLVLDGIELDITERRQQEQKIRELNATLEKRVEERTAELSSTLENLKRAQEELLQREKLASLGALVAGVAHELNTPIGNALMVATSFEPACKKLDTALQGGLTRSALQGFLDEIREGSLIIERNLARSAELIGSFKQLAVDQTSYQRRPFELKELAHEVLTTLRPTLRKMPFVLRDELCENVRLDSYPGPLGQVLINLVNNALTHAFAGRQEGVIWLRGHIEEGMVHVSVSDDGIGMMPEQLKKIFDPFYTTQLGKGGSGLGLHIVYTLVNGLLGGRIEVRSTPGSGTCFTLILPRVAP